MITMGSMILQVLLQSFCLTSTCDALHQHQQSLEKTPSNSIELCRSLVHTSSLRCYFVRPRQARVYPCGAPKKWACFVAGDTKKNSPQDQGSARVSRSNSQTSLKVTPSSKNHYELLGIYFFIFVFTNFLGLPIFDTFLSNFKDDLISFLL